LVEQSAPPKGTAALPAPAEQSSSPNSADPASAIVTGVPEVIDPSTLRIHGKVVRLFGVERVRGGRGEALARYVRGRDVICRPAPKPDAYRCRVGERDLSIVVLYNGGGRVSAEATPDLLAAEKHARAERIGIWAQ